MPEHVGSGRDERFRPEQDKHRPANNHGQEHAGPGDPADLIETGAGVSPTFGDQRQCSHQPAGKAAGDKQLGITGKGEELVDHGAARDMVRALAGGKAKHLALSGPAPIPAL